MLGTRFAVSVVFKMYKLTLLVAVFGAALAARDSLTVNEYNQVMDKTIKGVSEPILSKLPKALRNYRHEIFSPRKPGYHPSRYNVILSNIKLNRVGSIEREGDCVIPNPNRISVANCFYKVKDYTFGAKGKNGEDFNERLTFTLVVSTYNYRTPDANRIKWKVWCPWVPGYAYLAPTYEDTLSAEIKAYLGKVDTTSIDRFKEFIVSTFEDLFYNYDDLSLKFNDVLKELKLD